MIALTIDCEQWNLLEIRGKKSKVEDDCFYSFEGNKRLLNILEKYNIKSTFFISGYFAERKKEQVKEISKKGHEIASHGYCHFYRNNPNLNIKEDVLKSKKIIENITKKKIIGFRAPQMQFSLKLINILEELNFKYDSSIHAANIPFFYNNKKSPLKPYKIGKIIEIPASASYSLRLPISWSIMRNLPLIYTTSIVKKLIKKNIVPVLYFHSWEFYEVKEKGLRIDITRNTGEKFSKKFEKFLEKFRDEKFVLMKELVL